MADLYYRFGSKIGLGEIHFSPVIYREEPIFVQLAQASRAFSVSMEAVKARHPDYPNLIDSLKENEDVFAQTIAGTSLFDVEKMALPLDEQDIRKINRMVQIGLLPNSALYQRRARQILLFLPVQVAARPDIAVPEQLKPLVNRGRVYLDYYTQYIMKPAIRWEDELNLIKTCTWLMGPFVQALGAYTPARWGITPSSVEKRYYERQINSQLTGGDLPWAMINSHLIPETREAYLGKNLPSHLQSYQHLDVRIDERASQFLRTYFDSLRFTQNRDFQAPEYVMERLNLYKKVLRREILSSKDHLVREKFEDHPVLDQVLLTSQNRQVLMLVLLFKDGATHLTLEVGEDNTLYGVPPSLIKEYPHAADLLIQEVVGRVVDRARVRYPTIEPMRQTSNPVVVSRPVILPGVEIARIQGQFRQEDQGETEEDQLPLKRKVPVIVLHEPELPKPPEVVAPKFRVLHTRDQVRGYFGKKGQEAEVDRIMRDIARIEMGQKPIKSLTDLPGFFSARVGDTRIILQAMGGMDLTVYTIAPRETVYKRL